MSHKSFGEMIADLREQAESDDPKVAKKAQKILNEIWKDWTNSVRQGYNTKLGIDKKEPEPFVFR